MNISMKEEFPTHKELESLQKLKRLRNLTLAWGEDSNRRSSSKTKHVNKPAGAALKPSLGKFRRTFTMNVNSGIAGTNTDQKQLKLQEYLEKLDL